jgi:LuxR family maltose regulon positive regulatory protein
MADTALPPVRHSALSQFVDQVSPREITVLQYLPSRLTDTEIAAALYISANTLKTHKRNVYRKLNVTTRRQAVDIARAAKVI